jgi:hypothetical protein
VEIFSGNFFVEKLNNQENVMALSLLRHSPFEFKFGAERTKRNFQRLSQNFHTNGFS